MKDLSIGKESTLILQFATPMLLGNVFQQLYSVVDSIIVGNYIGKEALAAVGASFPIIFALVSLVIGITIGSTIIIAQYFGAKNMEKVRTAIDTLYIFMLISAIVITIVGIIFSKPIFRLIKLPEEVIPQAVIYFNIYMAGSIFFFGFNGISAILRGVGDSKTPLYFLIFSTLTNAILALIFVIGFKWGIVGAALATVIAQALAFIGALIYLNRYHDLVKLNWRKYKFDFDIFKKGVKIGFPIGFQQAFVALGMMAMYWLVNRFGTNTTAAFSVVSRIDSFASMPAMNFASALSTFVGQNLGANKPERIKSGLWATFYMTAIISIMVSILGIVFGKPVMRLFINDPEVVNVGVSYLKIVTGFYIIFSTMFVVGAVMRGAGDTMIPMIITFLALWIVRIPICYLLSQRIGSEGIWWGIPIAWAIGLSLSFAYYLTGKWKKKVIIRAA